MFKLLQAHEEVDPNAVLKTQSKRAQKRIQRREKERESEADCFRSSQERLNRDVQLDCESAPVLDLDFDAAVTLYEEVFRQQPGESEQLLEDIVAQMMGAHLPASASNGGGRSETGLPEAGGRGGGAADGNGNGSFCCAGKMPANGRSTGAPVDCPPGPGPGSGLARWPNVEPSWLIAQVQPVRVSGRTSSLSLTSASLQRASREATAAGCGGEAGRSHSSTAVSGSPAHPGKQSPAAGRSPHAPSLGDRGDFPDLRPAASAPFAPCWADHAVTEEADGAGPAPSGPRGGGSGVNSSSRQGGGAARKGLRGAKHGRSPAGGIKVLNKAQPHHSHPHHHHNSGHALAQRGPARGGMNGAGGSPDKRSGTSGIHADGDADGGGGPGSTGGDLSLALLWELLQGGLLLREDPLGEDGGEGRSAPDPDPDGRAVIRRLVQAQCEHSGDGPARGVSQEEMIEMMARAHRRQRRKRTGVNGAAAAAADPGAGSKADDTGEGDSGSSSSEDEAHLYQDRDESKSWRRTMDWMERNDWVRMPDTGKHHKFRRMLPNGQLQVQTVCCTPSDAQRGIRNLQAELARKDAAANEVILAWRRELRTQRDAAAEAASAAAAAAEDD